MTNRVVVLLSNMVAYDKDENAYTDLLDYTPINENSNVVEVGSGGGQATTPILSRTFIFCKGGSYIVEKI